MNAEVLNPPPKTQEPSPQEVQPVGQNPTPIPTRQREAILAAIGGEHVDTFPDRDLVGGMLSDMFSPTAGWRESDLSPAEEKQKKAQQSGHL